MQKQMSDEAHLLLNNVVNLFRTQFQAESLWCMAEGLLTLLLLIYRIYEECVVNYSSPWMNSEQLTLEVIDAGMKLWKHKVEHHAWRDCVANKEALGVLPDHPYACNEH